MARPQKNGMDYFPHDTDALQDEKIEVLTSLYGNDGYAFYFILLERIYKTKNFELKINDEATIAVLAKKTNLTIEMFNKILQTCFDINLFDFKLFSNKNLLSSKGIKERSKPIIAKRLRAKEYSTLISATETTQKLHSNSSETTQELVSNSSETTQRKEKKRIEKKIIKEEDIYRQFEHLIITHEEHNKLLVNYTQEQITKVLDTIETYPKRHTYTELYITALRWLRKDYKTKQEQEQPVAHMEPPEMWIKGMTEEFFLKRYASEPTLNKDNAHKHPNIVYYLWLNKKKISDYWQ